MPIKTYDPGQHYFSLLGVPLSGFAEGSMIVVSAQSDTFQSYAGTTGEVCRVRLRDPRGTAKLRIMASSQMNDILSGIWLADKNNATGQGVFNGIDANGTTVVNCTSAWIKKMPDIEYSKELPIREWELELADLEVFIGGNA